MVHPTHPGRMFLFQTTHHLPDKLPPKYLVSAEINVIFVQNFTVK